MVRIEPSLKGSHTEALRHAKKKRTAIDKDHTFVFTSFPALSLAVSVDVSVASVLCVSEPDKEDSCGEMSVPSSPQNEAIQHSSISTSNGVSLSNATAAALASGPALEPSTEEEEEPQVGGASAAHTQSSGS